MTSGVPKKYHGGILWVPWGHQAEAGWVFPLHTTHCYSKTTGTQGGPDGGTWSRPAQWRDSFELHGFHSLGI